MRSVIFFLGLLMPLCSVGQNEDVIAGLSATEFNGKVLLTWSIKKGNTCNGVKVLHSLDSTNFAQIGSIEGICGSTAESISYDFTHLDPDKNAVNYYRLQLGGIGFSWIVNAEVLDLAGTNYVLRPNPVVGTSELFFDNGTNATFELKVFGLDGISVHEAETNGELFLLDAQDFLPGFYHFVISKKGELPKIKGKLEVF